MNLTIQLRGQSSVDPLMPLNEPLINKGVRHHHYFEMAL
jgi:hypothetical protein